MYANEVLITLCRVGHPQGLEYGPLNFDGILCGFGSSDTLAVAKPINQTAGTLYSLFPLNPNPLNTGLPAASARAHDWQ